MDITQLERGDRDTILAALRYWQTFRETGRPALGDRLEMIEEIAEENDVMAGPEHIDSLVDLVRTSELTGAFSEARHRDTVVAALRYWRHYVDTGAAADGPELEAILSPMSEDALFAAVVDEIDDLCEEINTGGQRLAP